MSVFSQNNGPSFYILFYNLFHTFPPNNRLHSSPATFHLRFSAYVCMCVCVCVCVCLYVHMCMCICLCVCVCACVCVCVCVCVRGVCVCVCGVCVSEWLTYKYLVG